MDGFYIAPAFMDKLVVHITKNFLTLPNIKVFFLCFFSHETSLTFCLEWNSIEFTLSWNFVDRFLLSLGIWGGKGQGKSFQCELVFAKMGIKWVHPFSSSSCYSSTSTRTPTRLIGTNPSTKGGSHNVRSLLRGFVLILVGVQIMLSFIVSLLDISNLRSFMCGASLNGYTET